MVLWPRTACLRITGASVASTPASRSRTQSSALLRERKKRKWRWSWVIVRCVIYGRVPTRRGPPEPRHPVKLALFAGRRRLRIISYFQGRAGHTCLYLSQSMMNLSTLSGFPRVKSIGWKRMQFPEFRKFQKLSSYLMIEDTASADCVLPPLSVVHVVPWESFPVTHQGGVRSRGSIQNYLISYLARAPLIFGEGCFFLPSQGLNINENDYPWLMAMSL